MPAILARVFLLSQILGCLSHKQAEVVVVELALYCDLHSPDFEGHYAIGLQAEVLPHAELMEHEWILEDDEGVLGRFSVTLNRRDGLIDVANLRESLF